MLPNQSSSQESVPASVVGVTETAQRAEAGGWDGAFCLHHLVGNMPVLQPLSTLAFAAQATKTIDLGTAIFVLPLTHPVAVAEEVATIDQLSGGRVILGVGAGYRREEFDAVDVPFAGRGSRMVEQLELMQALWRGECVSRDGDFFHISGATLGILPRQIGGPRIWIGAQRKKTILRALESGHSWLAPGNAPDPEWLERMATVAQSAVTPQGMKLDRPLLVELFVGQDSVRAREKVRPYIAREYENYSRYGGLEWFSRRFESMFERSFAIGDPKEVARKLNYLASLGFDYFVCRVQWSDMSMRDVRESIRLFEEEVRPLVLNRGTT